jgi:hypothetical protein
MDHCTVTKLDEDVDTNSSRIFRDKIRIPSVLKDETCEVCSKIFDHIISKRFPPQFSREDRIEWLATFHNVLIDQYKKGESISYDDDEFQDAYMFGYFPFYIGMCYHILRGMEFERPAEIFHDDLRICLYGCGPAPELLGFVAYLRDFQPHVRRINVTFFDQNLWGEWRDYCVTQLLPIFWDGKIQYELLKIDLLKFPEAADKGTTEAISSATIHNFQNVLSDLYKTPENLKIMGIPFFNLYQTTPTGSIVILSDQYYGETARIFEKISFISQKYNFGTTLVKPDSIHNYHREFDTPQPMMDIGHHYKNEMGFYAMILKRT